MSFLGKVAEQVAVQTVAGVVRKYAETGIKQAQDAWKNRKALLQARRRNTPSNKDPELEEVLEVDASSALRDLKAGRKK